MQHPTGYFPIRDLFLPFLCPFRFPASNRPAASSGIALNGYGSSFLSKYYLIPPIIAEEASSLVEFPVPALSVDVPVPNRPSPVEDQTVLRHVPVKENLGIVFRICYAPWSPVFEQNGSARRMLLSERTVCWIPGPPSFRYGACKGPVSFHSCWMPDEALTETGSAVC